MAAGAIIAGLTKLDSLRWLANLSSKFILFVAASQSIGTGDKPIDFIAQQQILICRPSDVVAVVLIGKGTWTTHDFSLRVFIFLEQSEVIGIHSISKRKMICIIPTVNHAGGQNLLGLIDTGDCPGFFPRLIQGRQQHCGQDRDDGNHDQQFN